MLDLTKGFKRPLPVLATASGLALSALFPIGIRQSISSSAFQALWMLHLVMLCGAALTSLLFLLHLALNSRWLAILPLGIAALFIVLIATIGFVPIVNTYALGSDLFVAKEWALADRVIELKWHLSSYAPQLLYPALAGMIFHDLAELIPAYNLFYLITLCGCVALFVCARNNDAEAGVIAFILTLSLPINIRLGASPGSELAAALFCVIACAAAVQWFSPKGSWLDLLLMAGAFGLSASIGYRGLLVLLLCGVLLLVLAGSSRASLAKALGTVCACAILSFPIYAPWLIRNIFWTNNPIYPILKRWFGAVGGLVAFSPQTLRPLPDQLIQYSGDWIDAVAIPWRMILSGRDGSLTHFDGVLSPILFLSLFPLALLRKEAWLPYFYLCLGSYFFCAACLSAPTIPLMAPIFGLVLILCACGVNLLGDLFSERHRFLLYTGIIGIQSVFGLLYGYDLAKRRDVLPYLSGQVSANEYLESRIPEYALIRTVNKDLPPTPLLYLLFIDSSFYYYNRPIISEGPNRSDFLRMLLSSSGSARLLAKELVNRNIGFIAWDQALSDEQLKHTLTPQEFTIWNRFQANHLKVVWQSERFRLAQILHRARRAKQRPENPTEAPPELKSQGNQAKFQGLVTVGK